MFNEIDLKKAWLVKQYEHEDRSKLVTNALKDFDIDMQWKENKLVVQCIDDQCVCSCA